MNRQFFNRIGIAFWILVVLLFLSLPFFAIAGTAKQKAAAAVAVGRARLAIADDHPDLPDGTSKSSAETVMARKDDIVSQANQFVGPVYSKEAEELAELKSELNETRSKLNEQSFAIAELKIAKADVSKLEPIAEPAGKMEMIFPESIQKVHFAMPAQLLISCWESGCPIGDRLKTEIYAQLKPLGWIVGSSEDCQIRFIIDKNKTRSCPHIELYREGVLDRYWDEYRTPAELSNKLKTLWDSVDIESANSAMQGNVRAMPTIKAAKHIRDAKSFLRKYVGDGNRMRLILDRSGKEQISLFAGGDWSIPAMLGNGGHLQIEIPNSIRLPVKSIGVGYRIEGPDFVFDGDPLRFPGLVDKLSAKSRMQAIGPQPAGIFIIDDLLFVTSVISAFETLFELFHPSLDVVIPPQVEMNVMLSGETIVADFPKPVQVKFVELFTFLLTVRKASLTETNCHIDSDGSWWLPRWVKSLDLKVQE